MNHVIHRLVLFVVRNRAGEHRAAVSRGRFALVGLGTVAAAVIANLLVYLLGSVVVGYDPQFIILANASGTILFTVVPAIVAVLLYAALMRFTSNPARIFTNIAVVVLIVSLIPDLTYIPSLPGATPGQTAILMVMHIVAAVRHRHYAD